MNSRANAIRAQLGEVESMQSELKRLREQLKTLRKEKISNEQRIMEEWDPDEVPEIADKDVIYKKQEKQRRQAKSKAEKIESIIDCLRENNVDITHLDPQSLANVLLECIRGELQEEYTIMKTKIRATKNKK